MPYGVGRPRGGGGTGGGATTSAPTLITTLSSSPNAPSSFRSRQMPVNAPSLSPDSIGTLTSIVLPGSSAPTFTGLLAPSCVPLTKASSVSALHAHVPLLRTFHVLVKSLPLSKRVLSGTVTSATYAALRHGASGVDGGSFPPPPAPVSVSSSPPAP